MGLQFFKRAEIINIVVELEYITKNETILAVTYLFDFDGRWCSFLSFALFLGLSSHILVMVICI